MKLTDENGIYRFNSPESEYAWWFICPGKEELSRMFAILGIEWDVTTVAGLLQEAAQMEDDPVIYPGGGFRLQMRNNGWYSLSAPPGKFTKEQRRDIIRRHMSSYRRWLDGNQVISG